MRCRILPESHKRNGLINETQNKVYNYGCEILERIYSYSIRPLYNEKHSDECDFISLSYFVIPRIFLMKQYVLISILNDSYILCLNDCYLYWELLQL